MSRSRNKNKKRQKNPAAVALGKLGARKSGGIQKWFRSLTPEQQREHQRSAIMRRWYPVGGSTAR